MRTDLHRWKLWKPTLFLAMTCMAGQALADTSAPLVDAECDTNNDGIVDDLPADYAEGQQYGNMLNFYAVTMAASPLHAPAPLEAFKLNASLELSYIPQLSCVERAVYSGYKTEHTNKSPVFPRIHVSLGLPYGFYAGLSGLPPVPVAGVSTATLAGELGWGHVLGERFELGARGTILYTHVVGDLAGPLPNESAVDDTFKDVSWAVEGMAGYRIPIKGGRVTPYLGLGYTQVHAAMHIGEDNADVPGSQTEIGRMLYWGPQGEVGAQLKYKRLDVALEAFMVPLNLVDPGNPRFFFSPRLSVGYDFF